MYIGQPYATCPSCGYCPHCGRGGHHGYPHFQSPYFGDLPNWGGSTSPNIGGFQDNGLGFEQYKKALEKLPQLQGQITA